MQWGIGGLIDAIKKLSIISDINKGIGHVLDGGAEKAKEEAIVAVEQMESFLKAKMDEKYKEFVYVIPGSACYANASLTHPSATMARPQRRNSYPSRPS